MSNSDYVASIPSVPVVIERPKWSVLIPTYNCARYLGETLESVLSQDPGRDAMEIIVVDDHSTDNPWEVVRRMGESRIDFIRQPRNVGKVRNYETGLERSSGRLIHQLHGDDRVRPGFYGEMESAFSAFPDAGAFFCQSVYIDENGAPTGQTGTERMNVGIIDNFLEKIVVQQRVQTPSMVMRREVYETLGAFDRRLDVFEDWEMWIRVANRYPVGFVPRALAEYRVSRSNSSTTSMLAGTRAPTLRRMLEIVDAYIPDSVLTKVKDNRDREIAQYLTQFIPSLMAARRFGAVARVYLDALSFSRHPRTWYRLLSYTRHYRRLLPA